jgi:outer membrane protein
MSKRLNSSEKRARNHLRALFCSAVCSVAVLLTASVPATAQAVPQPAPPTQAELAAYQARPDAEKSRLLIELAMGGDHEFAERLLKEFPLQGEFAANRTKFIEGLIKRGRGDLTGAAKTFRAVLANDPSLTLVRAELAKTLTALDQDDSAKHHLELLAAEAPDAEQAAAIKSFIDRIDAKRPFTLRGYVSAAPSSNLNNGSNHEKIYIPFGGREVGFTPEKQESGVGVAAGVSGAFTKRLGNKVIGVLAGGTHTKLYEDSRFNNFTASESAELRYLTDTGYIGMGLVGSQSFGSGSFSPNYTSVGPRVSLTHALTPQNNVTASAVYEWRNFNNNLQDGKALDTDFSWTHAFDSTFNVSLLGGYSYVTAEDKAFGYTALSGGVGFYKELTAGITLNAQATYTATEFNSLHSIVFPKIRKDDRFAASLAVTKRDFEIFGLAPSVSYSFGRNLSNIDLYDYDTHAFDFRLTTDF